MEVISYERKKLESKHRKRIVAVYRRNGRQRLTLSCGHKLTIGDRHNMVSPMFVGEEIECPEEPIQVVYGQTVGKWNTANTGNGNRSR